jgi:hypothetical protein
LGERFHLAVSLCSHAVDTPRQDPARHLPPP